MDSGHGKVVLVTGCSSGIGRATAEHLARVGFVVVATMRNPALCAPVRGAALTLALDVTDEASVRKAIERTIASFGHIDVLVNNAGYALTGPLEATTDEALFRQFDTNVFGVVRMMRAVLPHMRERKAGTIVNVSSVGGRLAFPLTSPYHGTKWALEGMTESCSYELAPFGIHVKLVEPGGIATDFAVRSMERLSHPAYQAMSEKLLARFAARKFPGPAKVAETIALAASDGSSRLRYLVHHEPFWSLHQALPALLWRTLMQRLLS